MTDEGGVLVERSHRFILDEAEEADCPEDVCGRDRPSDLVGPPPLAARDEDGWALRSDDSNRPGQDLVPLARGDAAGGEQVGPFDRRWPLRAR